MPLRYQCVICKGAMPMGEPPAHSLDPCALVIVGHADKEWRNQKEQTFYCHFECFRKLVGDDGVLYIKDADFSTNGAVADDQAEEVAAEERRAARGTVNDDSG